MSSKRWDASSVVAQLRLTSLRLGQLQERQDSQGVITRKDIATLLQQQNVGLARAKAQKLHREDALGDLLEVLEMYVGQLLEHFQELDQSNHLSPNVIEAASTIIYSAPYVGSKDLDIVSRLLAQHLGPDFARSAVANNDNQVSAVALRMASLSPSVKDLNLVLERIASEYGLTWTPEPLRQDILKLVSEILDPQTMPVVDLLSLRRLCRRGIPDEPRWLRPRIWKLLLGVLPVVKASWTKEIESQRNSYYGLVQRLLDPISALSSLDSESNALDAMLLSIERQLSTIPSTLGGDLSRAPGSFSSCPLDDDAKDEIKLNSARNLNLRLDILHTTNLERASPLTEKPSSLVLATPEISLSSPDASQSKEANNSTAMLLSLKPFDTNIIVHPKHFSALLRLLYVHASINPGNISPHIASLLVPLYVVLNHEIIPDDLAHVEADTFWLFEAMVGEVSELDDVEEGSICMKGLRDRLAWADSDLFNGLQARGLDPALPHYSRQWLASLLTHTLPLPSLLPIWDAIFSCSMRTRDVNPKVDHLLNVCTAMLIRVKTLLFRQASPLIYFKNEGSDVNRSGNYNPPNLWSEGQILHPPFSQRPRELGYDFTEGLAFLRLYPIEAAGGIDRLLQDAFDLALRRDKEINISQEETLSLSARIKATMWRGFTNQEPSPDISPEEYEDKSTEETSHEDNNKTEPSIIAAPSLTSRLATTVLRGITNQTSMEPPPSPSLPPSSSTNPFSPSISNSSSDPTSNIWAYADKIRDSDTMAAIAKVSSNWRAKSIMGSWDRSPSSNGQERCRISPLGAREGEHPMSNDEAHDPSMGRNGVNSLPRSQHFRQSQNYFSSRHNIPESLKEENREDGLIDRTHRLQASLAALTWTLPSRSKVRAGPRPLLLSPSTFITSPPIRPVSRSAGSSPAPGNSQWADVMRLKGHSIHRDSVSSISSLPPSNTLRSAQSSRSDWDSDTGTSSRRIPLNRKSVSPMAPSSRRQGHSPAMSVDRGLLSAPFSDQIDFYMKKVDSASPTSQPRNSTVIQEPHKNRVQMKDPGFSAVRLTGQTAPLVSEVEDTWDWSGSQTLSQSPRLKTKRHAPRPLDLNFENSPHDMERKLPNSKHLTVEWPSDDNEAVTTPRVSSYKAYDTHSLTTISSKSPRRLRKASAEAETKEHPKRTSTNHHETRVRKASSVPRPRKSPSDQRETVRGRESSAEEGDDEGYDDLLSAYESENSQEHLRDSSRHESLGYISLAR